MHWTQIWSISTMIQMTDMMKVPFYCWLILAMKTTYWKQVLSYSVWEKSWHWETRTQSDGMFWKQCSSWTLTSKCNAHPDDIQSGAMHRWVTWRLSSIQTSEQSSKINLTTLFTLRFMICGNPFLKTYFKVTGIKMNKTVKILMFQRSMIIEHILPNHQQQLGCLLTNAT